MHRCCIAGLLFTLVAVNCSAQDKTEDPVEQMVNRALKHLQKTQDKDGAWRLSGSKSPAATSLAVMAFLSAGHVPGEGPYAGAIDKGIRWVLKSQQRDGMFRSSHHGMYEHGISTLMLAEATGMTAKELSPEIRKAVEKAVNVILRAQRAGGSHKGGWRYQVNGSDGDLSVTGWQILALRAAKNIGCDIPPEAVANAIDYVKRCQDSRAGGFCYQPGGQLTTPCTGTGILCLELCGEHRSKAALRAGALLLRNPPVRSEFHFSYGIYYCSQATFQLGGNYWAFYRPRLHKVLLDQQQADGSWNTQYGYGKAYGTAMGVLALTVEYRYLPIYQRGSDSEKKDKSPIGEQKGAGAPDPFCS